MIKPTRVIAFYLNFWGSPFYVMTASCLCKLMWSLYRAARLYFVRWIRRICLIFSLIYKRKNLSLTSIIFELTFFVFTSIILMIASHSNHDRISAAIFISHFKGLLILLSLLFNILLNGCISFGCLISPSLRRNVYLMAEHNLVVCESTISSVVKTVICLLRKLLQIISGILDFEVLLRPLANESSSS